MCWVRLTIVGALASLVSSTLESVRGSAQYELSKQLTLFLDASFAIDRNTHRGAPPQTTAFVPADNPFVGVPDALPSIFTWGNRNAQGLAVHPVSGTIWATDAEGHDLIVTAGQEASLAAPGKIVFQYLGGIHRPRQIALTGLAGRTIYDFRDNRVTLADGSTVRPEALDGPAAAPFLRLELYPQVEEIQEQLGAINDRVSSQLRLQQMLHGMPADGLAAFEGVEVAGHGVLRGPAHHRARSQGRGPQGARAQSASSSG